MEEETSKLTHHAIVGSKEYTLAELLEVAVIPFDLPSIISQTHDLSKSEVRRRIRDGSVQALRPDPLTKGNTYQKIEAPTLLVVPGELPLYIKFGKRPINGKYPELELK